MFAIIIDENNYVKSYSDKYRIPGSILVNEIPTTEIEMLRCYQYIDGKYIFDAEKWDAFVNDVTEDARIAGVKQNIAFLKNELASSDYQIIKCYEYALNDLELPYDAEKLHEKRQMIRDQINELEMSI